MDTEHDRPRWRFTGVYAFTPRLQLGIEFSPAAEEFSPLANIILATESPSRPLITFGTSSDRIGTPRGYQSYYITIAKSVPGSPIAPYFSINYSEFESGINFPFGANFRLDDDVTLLLMNDGRKSHALLNVHQNNLTVTLMWVWLDTFGLSISGGVK